MNKTPSALKWLAEKRARLANDAAQTSKMAQELTARAQRLHSQLCALDETIRLYDEAIDPTAISAVNGWQCWRRPKIDPPTAIVPMQI